VLFLSVAMGMEMAHQMPASSDNLMGNGIWPGTGTDSMNKEPINHITLDRKRGRQ